jgi:hypothetical protein
MGQKAGKCRLGAGKFWLSLLRFLNVYSYIRQFLVLQQVTPIPSKPICNYRVIIYIFQICLFERIKCNMYHKGKKW